MSANGKDHSSGDGRISPEDREAIRQRSAEIGQKLDALKSRRAPAGGSPVKTSQSAFGPAFKFAGELVVGVVVGGGLGWALDKHFGTAPWLMIVLFILGFAAGPSERRPLRPAGAGTKRAAAKSGAVGRR